MCHDNVVDGSVRDGPMSHFISKVRVLEHLFSFELVCHKMTFYGLDSIVMLCVLMCVYVGFAVLTLSLLLNPTNSSV